MTPAELSVFSTAVTPQPLEAVDEIVVGNVSAASAFGLANTRSVCGLQGLPWMQSGKFESVIEMPHVAPCFNSSTRSTSGSGSATSSSEQPKNRAVSVTAMQAAVLPPVSA